MERSRRRRCGVRQQQEVGVSKKNKTRGDAERIRCSSMCGRPGADIAQLLWLLVYTVYTFSSRNWFDYITE
jgi:hypothetical protein